MEFPQFVCFIIVVVGIYEEVLGEKPMMVPQKDELLILEGTELKLECYGENVSLHFSFPKYTFMSPRSDHNISVAQNGTLTFLRRTTVSMDTGWYACAAEDVEIENDFKTLNHTQRNIAWIYVYVLSSEPFADRYYTFEKTIIILAGDPVIVPCRPTSPDLIVWLWRNFELQTANHTTIIQFDPRIGFIVEPPASVDVEEIFQCNVNDVEDNYIVRYSNATGRRPRMTTATDELVLKVGDELRIECYGKTNIQFTYLNFEMDYIPFHKILSNRKGQSTFVISSVESFDTGWYGCTDKGIDTKMHYYYLDYTKKEINWIYVYVESNPAVLLEFSGITLTYTDAASIIVPCRPTSPSLNVQLKWESKIIKLDENVRFHSKLGFVMRRGPNLPTICYSCATGEYSSAPTCFEKLPKQHDAPHPTIVRRQLLPLIGEDIRLDCEAKSGNMFDLKWRIPTTIPKKRVDFGENRHFSPVPYNYRSLKVLSITNLTVNDSGEYTCVSNNAENKIEISEIIRIFDPNSVDYVSNERFLKNEFIKRRGQSLKWMFDDRSLPVIPKFIRWILPSKQIIESGSELDHNKYKIWFRINERWMLEIQNLTFYDSGVHNVYVFDHDTHFLLNLKLDVQGTPSISIQNGSEPYYPAPGQAFLTICNVTGSPKPNITWNFAEHSNFTSDRNSSLVTKFDFSPNYKDVPDNRTNTTLSYMNMSTEMSGMLTCTACNSFNCSSTTRHIIVSDGIGRFGIIGPKADPHIGDDIALTCAGSINVFTNLIWDKEFDECCKIVGCEPFYVKEYQTQFTIRSVLHMKHLTRCHQRRYTCLGRTVGGNNESSSYYLRVPRKLQIISSNLNQSKIIFDPVLGGKTMISMTCCFDGEPKPNVTWFKNDFRLEASPEHYFVPHNCELVVVLDLRKGNGGRYMCKGQNLFGTVDRWIDVVVEEKAAGKNLSIVIIASFVFFIVILVVLLGICKHLMKKSRRKTKEAILERFDEGALDYLDPKLDIVDQAEILPYDEKWEYPRELLKLEKVLGNGAFGIVRKAQAISICPREPSTTVAVKMVCTTSNLHQMTALSRELKVLIYLGQHVNIVNLLGACTKNVNYGELFVVVEFCRFGNLQEYLFHSRTSFINQIDEVTDEIIGPNYRTNRPSVDQNCATEDRNSNSNTERSRRSSNSTTSDKTAEEAVPNHISAKCGLRSKYESDRPNVFLEPMSTKDLVCWAWQVARGMRYLGRRKVVHGDLAARNILLADNNIIKICDFGMAKALSKDDDFKEAGDDPLPLKWMAVESIKNRTFSVQSDIWSYGIVLWEFFSLAESLYPEIDPKFLYQKLINGYRMDRPKYAPKIIYRMMLKCWEADPTQRPTFAEIERDLNTLLDYDVKTYYVESGALYSDIDCEYVETGKKDYLTMDPSQIATVSFSKDRDQVEISKEPSGESPDPVGPGPSSTVKVNLSGPNTD